MTISGVEADEQNLATVTFVVVSDAKNESRQRSPCRFWFRVCVEALPVVSLNRRVIGYLTNGHVNQ